MRALARRVPAGRVRRPRAGLTQIIRTLQACTSKCGSVLNWRRSATLAGRQLDSDSDVSGGCVANKSCVSSASGRLYVGQHHDIEKISSLMMDQDEGHALSLKVLGSEFDGIWQPATDADLQREMERFAKEAGFDALMHAIGTTAPALSSDEFHICGYPPAWIERYLAREYFKVDPVIQHLQKSTLPVLWDASAPGWTEKAAEFWEDAQLFGLRAGLSFAVHAHPGVVGVFSLARDRSLDLNGQELAALIGRAQLFATLLQTAVLRMHMPRALPRARGAITTRERECLKWAATGKTAREIAGILGIAERTAIFHMNNVIQKLGATNKTHAIARAMFLKYI
jgi:DNA-binding CsgD family transcriptional regulator